MNKNIRHSGIGIVGDMPWGAHFCLFYQIKQDLLDIIISFFKSGLENNELCIWILPEFLKIRGAKETLKVAIPNIETYLDKGQIEIISYDDWYLSEDIFDSQKVLEGLNNRLNEALSNGYEGLRLIQDAFWQKDDLDDFIDYEEKLNSIIGEYPAIVLCTYELNKLNPINTIEIASNHDFFLLKKKGKWEQTRDFRQNNVEERKLDKNISTAAINSINQFFIQLLTLTR